PRFGYPFRSMDAARKRYGHIRVLDRSCESAVADSQELMIPVERHPYFEMDIRIGAWLDHAGHTAECGQAGVGNDLGGGISRLERPCLHRLRGGDGRVREFHTSQALTACTGRERSPGRRQADDAQRKNERSYCTVLHVDLLLRVA